MKLRESLKRGNTIRDKSGLWMKYDPDWETVSIYTRSSSYKGRRFGFHRDNHDRYPKIKIDNRIYLADRWQDIPPIEYAVDIYLHLLGKDPEKWWDRFFRKKYDSNTEFFLRKFVDVADNYRYNMEPSDYKDRVRSMDKSKWAHVSHY